MKRKVITILVSCFVLVAVQTAYAGSDIDTLYPTDEHLGSWVASGCSDKEDCVDDPIDEPDDWTTCLYAVGELYIQSFVFDETDFTSIDSIVLHVRAWCAGGNGTDTLRIGWRYWDGDTWKWNATDDLEVTTTTTITDFSHNCPGSWTYATVNNKRFGFLTTTPEPGEPEYVTQIYLLVYGEAPVAGNAWNAKIRRFSNLQ